MVDEFRTIIRHYLVMMLKKHGVKGDNLWDCTGEINGALDSLEMWIRTEIKRQIEATMVPVYDRND